MSNLIKILSLPIFIVSIWSVNSFFLPMVTKDLDIIDDAKKELLLKESFNASSPANLSQSINQFVSGKFDKNQIIDLIATFARDSGVEISSLDVQPDNSKETTPNANVSDDQSKTATPAIGDTKVNLVNTLKSVKLNVSIKGNKNDINLFTSKLANSKQYMDIQSIDMTFNKSPLGGGVQDISSIITAKIYYVTL